MEANACLSGPCRNYGATLSQQCGVISANGGKGSVASFPHGTYRGVPIARAAFGIKERKAVRLLRAEKEPLRTHAIEAVGGLATNLAIREIGVQPYSAEDLERAGKRFAEFTENPRLLVPAAARRLVA